MGCSFFCFVGLIVPLHLVVFNKDFEKLVLLSVYHVVSVVIFSFSPTDSRYFFSLAKADADNIKGIGNY